MIKRILLQIKKNDKELLLKYCKPYSDYSPDCKDKNKRKKLRRFDEYEWRYIPKSGHDKLNFSLQDIYRIYVPTNENKDELEEKFPLYKEKIHVK